MRHLHRSLINAWILSTFLLSCSHSLMAAETEEGRIAYPPKTRYDGRDWIRDTAWQDEEIYVEANLDEDEEKEVVIGYVGFFKPRRERKEGPQMFKIPQRDIAVIETRVFYKIFDRDAGGHWECVRTLTGLEHPGEIHIVGLPEGDTPGLLIISGGGKIYKDISLYQWHEGGYRFLGNTGVPSQVKVHKKNHSFCLEIQNSNSNKKCVLLWDGPKRRLFEKCLPESEFQNFLANL